MLLFNLLVALLSIISAPIVWEAAIESYHCLMAGNFKEFMKNISIVVVFVLIYSLIYYMGNKIG